MVIITTIGTSLLSNLYSKEIKICFGQKFEPRHRDAVSEGSIKMNLLRDLSIDILTFINGSSNNTCEKYKKSDKYGININASAEIKSICTIANGKPATVYLLATDTDMSEFAAEKIKDTLNGINGLTVFFDKTKHRINDLKIDNPEKFQEAGFEKLIEAIDSSYNIHKNEEVILNISGGYKALIPFLTIYGQLRRIELNYIYEDSEKLITIKPLPLNFDWAVAEIYNQYITSAVALSQVDENSEIYNFLRINGIINISKKLTTTGRLFKSYIEMHLPDRQDVLGHYMEHKLLDYFYENPYLGFEIRKLGEAFWWDTIDKSKYYNSQQENTIRIEIDLQLKKSNEYFFIECKSYSNANDAIKQIERYIEFNELSLKHELTKVGIFIYKFNFQRLIGTIFHDLATKCKEKNIELYLMSFDVPINFDKGTITYKKLFETKFIIDDNFHIIKLTI